MFNQMTKHKWCLSNTWIMHTEWKRRLKRDSKGYFCLWASEHIHVSPTITVWKSAVYFEYNNTSVYSKTDCCFWCNCSTVESCARPVLPLTEVDLEHRRCTNCISQLNLSFMHCWWCKKKTSDNRCAQQSVEALAKGGEIRFKCVYRACILTPGVNVIRLNQNRDTCQIWDTCWCQLERRP